MKELLQKISPLYRLHNVQLVRRVTEGYMSHNYVLADDAAYYFLKKYRFTDKQRIVEIHRAKHFFAEGGTPIILPLRTEHGESFFRHDGAFYALFPFVEGRVLRRATRSAQAFTAAGATLAHMHLLSTVAALSNIKKQENGWDAASFFTEATKIEAIITSKQRQTDFDQLALETINCKRYYAQHHTQQFSDLGLANDHLIHGDYHGANLFYDKHNAVQSVFDLEKTKYAPRSIELVRAIEYMCLSNNYTPQGFASARAFMRGYQSVYPIKQDELRRGMLAFLLDKIHSLWIESEHYLHDNQRVDCFLPNELACVRYYSAHLDATLAKICPNINTNAS